MTIDEIMEQEKERIKAYAVFNRNIAKQIWPDLK